tara:strand:- start:234 stop:890 length:657 start_codon:yes stop_codon:yes gene_type:complete
MSTCRLTNLNQNLLQQTSNVPFSLRCSKKLIKIILIGPHYSGKTHFIYSLFQNKENKLDLEVINNTVSLDYIKDLIESNVYEPSSVLEKYTFSLKNLYMDICVTDTSGSSMYFNILQKFTAQENDMALLIFDHNTNLEEFKQYYDSFFKVKQLQMIIIIINCKCSNPENYNNLLETYCINNNIFHMKVNIETDIYIIIKTIQSIFFTSPELKFINQNS